MRKRDLTMEATPDDQSRSPATSHQPRPLQSCCAVVPATQLVTLTTTYAISKTHDSKSPPKLALRGHTAPRHIHQLHSPCTGA